MYWVPYWIEPIKKHAVISHIPDNFCNLATTQAWHCTLQSTGKQLSLQTLSINKSIWLLIGMQQTMKLWVNPIPPTQLTTVIWYVFFQIKKISNFQTDSNSLNQIVNAANEANLSVCGNDDATAKYKDYIQKLAVSDALSNQFITNLQTLAANAPNTVIFVYGDLIFKENFRLQLRKTKIIITSIREICRSISLFQT